MKDIDRVLAIRRTAYRNTLLEAQAFIHLLVAEDSSLSEEHRRAQEEGQRKAVSAIKRHIEALLLDYAD